MPTQFDFRSAFFNLARYLRTSICFVLILFARLVALIYAGPYANWLGHSFDNVAYAAAWCFLLALMWPWASALRLAQVAVAICFGLEFLQLWHPWELEIWRASEFGRLIVGSSFAWSDLPFYALGGLLSGLWLSVLPAKVRSHTRPCGVPS